MLALDFINTGNGDSVLIRELEQNRQIFAMMIDCGHDCLIRDDHPAPLDARSRRIYAGDFLKKQGVTHIDLLILTHFHRDHIGGLERVLDAADVDCLLAAYIPPLDAPDLDPDGLNGLPSAARNLLRCANIYRKALSRYAHKIKIFREIHCNRVEYLHLTDDLSMEILSGEPALYPRQRAVMNAAFAGERNRYDLMRWTKSMNASSLRQRIHYHKQDIVLGGDFYGVLWDNDTLDPCKILKVPHHASISSVTPKFLDRLHPEIMVVCVAAGRPDLLPYPATVQLLQSYTPQVYFTDAVDIPGITTPVFHESVHIELE